MKKSYLTVTDQFCGAGGSSIGAIAAGAEIRQAMNHWKRALETYATNHPEADVDCTDVSACDPRRYPPTDILITSPECFPAGTIILAERGLLPIENIEVGDKVLTHQGRWMPVTQIMRTVKDTVVIRGQGNGGLETTIEHPFYVREQSQKWDNSKRDYNRRIYHNPEWVTAAHLTERKLRWATPIKATPLFVPPIAGRGFEFSGDFWWIVGRWLGDGSLRIRDTNSELTICCGKREIGPLKERLGRFLPNHEGRAGKSELRWRCREIRTGYLFETGHAGLCAWLLEHFGEHADGKTIPAWAITMLPEWRSALVEGYISADGHRSERRTRADSISKRLALGIRLLAESLGFRALFNVYTHSGGLIEGREFQSYDMWTVAWETNGSQRAAFDDGLHAWSLIKSIDPGRLDVEVYNLSVAEDESYVADGIVVHNCTNHSLAKGKQRKFQAQMEMFGKVIIDPAEERSRATMWDVPRFAETHNYRLIIVENVVDARHWRLFEAWLHAMRLLDYDHEIVYFNSMFAHPTPQSRDRMYVVFWKRGNKAPDLRFTPPAFCQRCATNVSAVQSWKNPGKKWGRYGKNRQYLYLCPVCAGDVTPYYYCAANAIDWSLSSERIGDRKKPLKEKTLERIRVGLEKYGRQPFLTSYYTRYHGAANSPINDAMPTQPSWPVHYLVDLGHTHAEHPGKVHHITEPMSTQTSRQTMAFVVSMRDTPNYPMKHVTEPLPTQSTVGAPYLVELYGKSDARSIDEPISSILTTPHHGLVMPYLVELHGTATASPLSDPLGCVLAGGNHHGLVQPQPFLVSYYSGSDQVKAVTDPVATVSTHDRHGLVQPEPTLEDCYFRMLKSHEIGKAMAFPQTYVVTGNERERVKQYGNAVTPPVMAMLIERCVETFK